MVALNDYLMIGSFEVMGPLLHDLQDGQEFMIRCVVVLLAPEHFQELKLTGLRIPKPWYKSRIPVIAKPLALGCKIIGCAGSKVLKMGISVKVLFSLRNASSAS